MEFSQQLTLCFPDDRHADKVMPVMDNVVLNPNEILHNIISIDSISARKFMYFLLSQNHLAEKEKLIYIMPMTEIYKKSFVDSKAYKIGPDIEEEVKKSLGQSSTGIRVSHHFIRLYANDKDVKSSGLIWPLELVYYKKKSWVMHITKAFKFFLITYQQANDPKLSFTKGDKNILLKQLWHDAADRLYWIIRQQQWTRGTLKFDVVELKTLLGRHKETVNNFYYKTLPRIQNQMVGTWTEFSFSKENARTKGNPIKNIVIKFDKDEVLLNKIKLNFTNELEIALYRTESIPIATIQQIKHNIKESKEIKDKQGFAYTWNYFYVMYTFEKIKKLRANGKVRDFIKYFTKSVFEGMFAQEAYTEMESNPPLSIPMFGERQEVGISIPSSGIPVSSITPFLKGKSLEEYIVDRSQESGETFSIFSSPITGESYIINNKELDRLEKREIKYVLSQEWLSPTPIIEQNPPLREKLEETSKKEVNVGNGYKPTLTLRERLQSIKPKSN